MKKKKKNVLYLTQMASFVFLHHMFGCFFFFFFVIRHSFTIEDLVSAPNLKLGCAVILRGCASDYK